MHIFYITESSRQAVNQSHLQGEMKKTQSSAAPQWMHTITTATIMQHIKACGLVLVLYT